MLSPAEIPQDDISLGELIRRGKSFWTEIRRHRQWPVVLALAGAAAMTWSWWSYKPVYPATITFSVDEDEAGSASGLAGMLGQFGLGNLRPARYNLDKILALSKSRRVIQEVFFRRITMSGESDFLANHMLRAYGLDQVDGQPFAFSHDSLDTFSRIENDRLLALYETVVGPPDKPKKALVQAEYNEDTNIMSITAATTEEVLSFELANGLFQSLSGYYVNKAIEKQLKTFRIVSAKRDSIMAALRTAEFQLASFKDRGRDLVLRTDQLTEPRLQREIIALSAMYAEVAKNAEVADFALRNKTPFIQVIDSPVYPIRPLTRSLPKKILIGLFLGGLAGGMVVILRKILREAVAGDGRPDKP